MRMVLKQGIATPIRWQGIPVSGRSITQQMTRIYTSYRRQYYSIPHKNKNEAFDLIRVYQHLRVLAEEFQSYSNGWGMSPAVRLEASRLGERLMASQQATAPTSSWKRIASVGSTGLKNRGLCVCQMIFLYGFVIVCHVLFNYLESKGTIWSWE